MEMHFDKVYQVRAYTTKRGYSQIDDMLVECARLYNAALEHRKTAYKQAGVSVNLYGQMREFTGVRADDPDGWGSRSVCIGRGVLRRLDRAMQAFFRRVRNGETPGFPRFKPSRRWHTIEMALVTKGMVKRLESGEYRVKVKGLPLIRMPKGRELPPSNQLKTMTITKRGRRLFVNLGYELKRAAVDSPPTGNPSEILIEGATLLCDTASTRTVAISRLGSTATLCDTASTVSNPKSVRVSPVTPRDTASTMPSVGVDMGVSDRLALSTGERIGRRRKPNERLEAMQRRLSRCRKGSRRWRERKAILANHQHRERIRNRNACHRITTDIVRRFGLIVVEALQVRSMTRSAKGTIEEPGKHVAAKSGLNKAILEQTWGVIHRQLAYKAEWAGIEFVEVNPQHTSQTCSGCGVIDADNRRGKRYSCQACGLEMDADINAAVNILHKAIGRQAGAVRQRVSA